MPIIDGFTRKCNPPAGAQPSGKGGPQTGTKLTGLAAKLASVKFGTDEVVIGEQDASIPEEEIGGGADTVGSVGRDRTDLSGYPGMVGETMIFLASYIVLPESSLLVMAAWVVAAWLMDVWDRFPHLAVTSPEKRCGKTTLMDVLKTIVPRPLYTTNISPAVLYRVIEATKPTLLMDESQSISRRGSEASEVIREILNASIGRNAKVLRCCGANNDQVAEFNVYSPKVFAMIGEPDGVLADRCLPVSMKRKTKEDKVKRYRSRVVEADGKTLHDKLEQWAQENAEKIAEIYDSIEPFDIENDRMADLLTPLQAVLTLLERSEGMEGSEGISEGRGRSLQKLQQYAKGLDERDKEQETQTPGVRLLIACREIFSTVKLNGKKGPCSFISTDTLIGYLVARQDEPWAHYRHGKDPISREALANLLRPYGIKPEFNEKRTGKGYYAARFQEPWDRYLPAIPPEIPSILSNPSNPSPKVGGGK
jgi:Protein of unknown function (DUF3631)